MKKIAIISDVHGNYQALKRVLEDINEKGITSIYCLGDVIGKGTRPNECLDLLENCTMVYGNWEDFYNNKICKSDFDEKRYKLLDEQLSNKNKERLKKLPLSYEMYISGRLVRMFHATPNNAWDNVLEIDGIDKLYSQFLPTQYTSDEVADIVIYGHTHMQNLMKLYNRTLINTGSVGNAFDIIRNKENDAKNENTTNANYLIIEGEIDSKDNSDINFSFVSLNYDIDLEIKESKSNPEFEDYSMELLTGEFRNVKKYKDNFEESNYDIDNI